jgi:hypothetical protein
MGTEVSTTRQLSGIARRLAAEHDACTKSANDSLEHAKRAGGLLCDAKELVEHGEWEGWLTEHFPGDVSTAQIYMRIFRHWPEIEQKRNAVPVLSLRGAVKVIAKPRASQPTPALPSDEFDATRDDAGSGGPDDPEPNPPETPDSPPEAPTSPQSVPADEEGLDDDQDPGERYAGASVAQEPLLEVDADSIPCTKAFADIRERLSRCLKQIQIKHPKTTGVEVRTAFAMAVEGIYG